MRFALSPWLLGVPSVLCQPCCVRQPFITALPGLCADEISRGDVLYQTSSSSCYNRKNHRTNLRQAQPAFPLCEVLLHRCVTLTTKCLGGKGGVRSLGLLARPHREVQCQLYVSRPHLISCVTLGRFLSLCGLLHVSSWKSLTPTRSYPRIKMGACGKALLASRTRGMLPQCQLSLLSWLSLTFWSRPPASNGACKSSYSW